MPGSICQITVIAFRPSYAIYFYDHYTCRFVHVRDHYMIMWLLANVKFFLSFLLLQGLCTEPLNHYVLNHGDDHRYKDRVSWDKQLQEIR